MSDRLSDRFREPSRIVEFPQFSFTQLVMQRRVATGNQVLTVLQLFVSDNV